MDHLTSLLLAAQRGDRLALERFVAATHTDVLAICRQLGDAGHVEDLAQQTYERALGSLHRYRATGPARNWLLTIARRTCADATRSRIRRRRHDHAAIADATLTITTAASPQQATKIALDRALAGLDPDRRAAFVLTQQLGLRYDEAAEVLGVPIGTIRSRVARARADLVEALEPAPASELRRSDGRP